MSGASRIARHGRNHVRGGSDPIPGIDSNHFCIEVHYNALSTSGDLVGCPGGGGTVNWQATNFANPYPGILDQDGNGNVQWVTGAVYLLTAFAGFDATGGTKRTVGFVGDGGSIGYGMTLPNSPTNPLAPGQVVLPIVWSGDIGDFIGGSSGTVGLDVRHDKGSALDVTVFMTVTLLHLPT